MTASYFLSAAQYAQEKKLSKMQVIRQIRAGLIPAQKVGNNWLIFADSTANQVSLTKTTSLQIWAKLVKNHLHQSLDIERSKDRETIFAQMHSLGLPHQRSFSIPQGKPLSHSEFSTIINRLGFPYWISAVPDSTLSYLDRQTKLCLTTIKPGWEFINSLVEKDKYKIILSQYGTNVIFSGTLFVSPSGQGVAEFVTGDRHYLMTRGFTLTDPLLFNNSGITKFSSTIPETYQKEFFGLIQGLSGHFEFSFGTLDHHPQFYFFDYTQEHHYTTNIDSIWKPLLGNTRSGLTCFPGKVTAPALIVHHQDFNVYHSFDEPYVLISDTLTPDMIPLLANAKGVVTDLGGVTSHPSIVLRELKIPTVVGAIDATSRFITGKKVNLNATTGTLIA